MAKLDENIKIVMLKGEKGEKGETGAGAPKGGKTGQYLQKKSDADYDWRWSEVVTVTWDSLAGKPSTFPTTWASVNGKPSTFAPTPSTTKNFTLTAASWSGGQYTISDSLITATSNQEILPAVGITSDQMKALQMATIVDAGQSAGALTIKALGAVPSIDIPIRVIFRGTI